MEKLTVTSYFSKKSDTQFLNNNVPCIFFFKGKFDPEKMAAFICLKSVIETLKHQNV